MNRLRYETKGGTIDESATYLQLIEHLRLAAEAAYILDHYRKANDSHPIIGQGFLAVGQMLEKTVESVTMLATGKLKQ
jgi:hypothetical protein